MKVQNLESPRTGRPVPNQFIITADGAEVFQSYQSAIVRREIVDTAFGSFRLTMLDEHYWDYSVTTSKYRNQFLGETKKETQAKLDSGEYIFADLNP